MTSRAKRVLAIVALAGASACSAQETSDAVEGAVESFFVELMQFVLVMLVIAAVAVVLWSLLIAGGVAAIVAALKRRSGDAEAEGSRPSSHDPLGTGMLVFGIVLVISAASSVCTISVGPTGAGETTIPLPLIALGIGLIIAANRRRSKPEKD